MKASLEGRPLDALLLDLDDTILDDRAGSEEAWQLAADLIAEARPALARDVLMAEIVRARTWFWDDPERHRRGRLDLVAARAEILGLALSRLDEPDPALVRRAGQAFEDLRDRRRCFLPGALEALAQLRERVPAMALVTNGGAGPQRGKVERFGLAPYFDHVQIEGEFGMGKPETAVYRHVLERLGVAPDGCLMVGDNFEADVVGAQLSALHAA